VYLRKNLKRFSMGKQTKEKRESREKEPAFKRKDEIANGRRDMAS